jgi:hypothetical protein
MGLYQGMTLVVPNESLYSSGLQPLYAIGRD